MKRYLLLIVLPLFLLSCEDEQYKFKATDIIELQKDPCFGFCPVYSFKINGLGQATFEGLKNVEKEGEWKRALSIEETNGMFQVFVKSNFWDFEDEYTAQVTDLPTTWISLTLNGKEKKIKDYYGAPPELKELEKMVEILAESELGWVKSDNQ